MAAATSVAAQRDSEESRDSREDDLYTNESYAIPEFRARASMPKEVLYGCCMSGIPAFTRLNSRH